MYDLTKIAKPCCLSCMYGFHFDENMYGECWYETPKTPNPEYPKVHKDHVCSYGSFIDHGEKFIYYCHEEYYECLGYKATYTIKRKEKESKE